MHSVDAYAPAADPARLVEERLPPAAEETEPPTAIAWARSLTSAVAAMSPAAWTSESSMNARVSRPSAASPPMRLRLIETPIETLTVLVSCDPVDQATDTAPDWAKVIDESVAVRVILPAVERTLRISAGSSELLALMNASVSFFRTFTAAAPAMATLLMLPRAIAPPIENASRTDCSVAVRLMSPPALTVAWWMKARVVSCT